MSTKSSFLKAALLAAITSTGATAATADEVTVFVYEKGYMPNLAYLDGATSIKFVNKTNKTLGLDYTSGSIMVNSFNAGSSVTLSSSSLAGKPLREPYVFGVGYYDGEDFAISDGATPNADY